jgi:hypothetical protein
VTCRPGSDRYVLKINSIIRNGLIAIQQMLGHWTVSSTMRYVRPSATFIEDAYRRAVSGTLGELAGEEPAE